MPNKKFYKDEMNNVLGVNRTNIPSEVTRAYAELIGQIPLAENWLDVIAEKKKQLADQSVREGIKLDEIKEIEQKINQLDLYTEYRYMMGTHSYEHRPENLENAKDLYRTTKQSYESRSGWEKFWARILPGRWYAPAEERKKLEAYEEALDDAGISVNENAEILNEPAPIDENVSDKEAMVVSDVLENEKNIEPERDYNLDQPTQQKDLNAEQNELTANS